MLANLPAFSCWELSAFQVSLQFASLFPHLSCFYLCLSSASGFHPTPHTHTLLRHLAQALKHLTMEQPGATVNRTGIHAKGSSILQAMNQNSKFSPTPPSWVKKNLSRIWKLLKWYEAFRKVLKRKNRIGGEKKIEKNFFFPENKSCWKLETCSEIMSGEGFHWHGQTDQHRRMKTWIAPCDGKRLKTVKCNLVPKYMKSRFWISRKDRKNSAD